MMLLESEIQELNDTIHVLNESIGRGSSLAIGGGSGVLVTDTDGTPVGMLNCDPDDGWYFDTEVKD